MKKKNQSVLLKSITKVLFLETGFTFLNNQYQKLTAKIRTAANSNAQLAKLAENLNHNSFAVAINILDKVFSELSLDNLENAKKILERIG